MEGISKVFVGGEGYNQVIAVNDLNLEVKDHEFLVILGPSGAGKTVLLRLVAGLDKLDKGRICLDGQEISDLSPGERGVAMVFEDFGLYPHMTAYDNIAFGLRNIKVPEADIKKRVTEASRVLRITDLLPRRPKTLSAGQKQRVALGRAMVKRPRIFLMDEPFANLDAKLKVEMRNELKELHKELGATIVFVTHDQTDAMSLADRVVVIKEGKIVQVGTPDELYYRPANKFVAWFIGTPPTNFFEGRIVQTNGESKVDAGDFLLSIPTDRAHLISEKASGGKVFLGFRPEGIVVQGKGQRESPGSAMGKVVFVERVGPLTFLHLDLGRNSAIATSPEGLHTEIGDAVHLSFDLNQMHVFDAETEETIV